MPTYNLDSLIKAVCKRQSIGDCIMLAPLLLIAEQYLNDATPEQFSRIERRFGTVFTDALNQYK